MTRNERPVGGALALAIICLAVVGTVGSCQNSQAPEVSDTGPMAKSYELAERQKQSAAAAESATRKRKSLEISPQMQTAASAIVCDQALIIGLLASSHKEKGRLSQLHDAFDAVFDRAEKAKDAGCEEWRAGVRVYQVGFMRSPLDDFIGFSRAETGMRDYFTMRSQLELLSASQKNDFEKRTEASSEDRIAGSEQTTSGVLE